MKLIPACICQRIKNLYFVPDAVYLFYNLKIACFPENPVYTPTPAKCLHHRGAGTRRCDFMYRKCLCCAFEGDKERFSPFVLAEHSVARKRGKLKKRARTYHTTAAQVKRSRCG